MRSIEALLLLVDLLALIGLSVPRAGAMRVLLPDLEPDCDSDSASASAPKTRPGWACAAQGKRD